MSKEKSSEIKLKSLFVGLVLALIVWGYFLTSIDGLDSIQYRKWTNCIESGELVAHSANTISVGGVDFFQWTPSLACMSYWLKYVGCSDPIFAFSLICKSIFVFNFWAAMDKLFPSSTRNLGCLLLLCSTEVTYYLRTSGIECVSIMLVGVLSLQIARLLKSEPINWQVSLGCAFLLLVVKSYLSIYALPVIVFGLTDAYKESLNQFLFRFGQGIIFFLIGLCLIGTHNQLMTGSFFDSPYTFGNEEFKSLDLANPSYFWNVMFDSFHGLLAVAPTTILGIGIMIWLPVRFGFAKDWRPFGIWSCCLFAVFINVWVNSCWYYWWMSNQSYGMRGLAMVGVPSLFALLVGFETLNRRARIGALVLLVLCSSWTFTSLTQGPTGYVDWRTLIVAQGKEWLYLFQSSGSLQIFLFCSIVLLFIPSVRKSLRHSKFIDWVCLYHLLLVLVYIGETFQSDLLVEIEYTIFFGLLFVASLAFFVFQSDEKLCAKQIESYCRHMNLFILLLCACTVFFFVVLFANIKTNQSSNARVASFQERDVISMIHTCRSSPRLDLRQLGRRVSRFFEQQVGKPLIPDVEVDPLSSHESILWMRKSGLDKFR